MEGAPAKSTEPRSFRHLSKVQQWGRVPYALIDQGTVANLREGACRVLIVLCAHCDEKFECDPGVRRIAALAGMLTGSVSRSLQELIDHGVLEREWGGKGRSAKYRLRATVHRSANACPSDRSPNSEQKQPHGVHPSANATESQAFTLEDESVHPATQKRSPRSEQNMLNRRRNSITADADDKPLTESERPSTAKPKVRRVLDDAGIHGPKRQEIEAIDGIELVVAQMWNEVKTRPAHNHAGLLIRVIENEAAERIAKHLRKRTEREGRIPAVAASADEIAARREAESTAWRVLRTVENFDELALLARDRATPAERRAWGDRPPDQCLDLAIAMAKLARARRTG